MKTAQIKLKNSFTPYPEYRDSGIEWVGKIPKEWNILKFKSLFIASDERVEDDRSVEQILSVSGYRGIEKKNIKSMDGQMPSEDISAYRIVRPGQLVVNTMWLNYTGLGVSDFTGYVSPAYRSYYIASSMHPKFVHSLLRSIPYVQKYSSLLYGIRPNSLQVKPADFEKIEVVVPSFETQKKIAEYLDEKTALIDQIIEKKKKLIALLREKRTAVINNAVTKGLDPSVELVHSGIEWIDKIPKGWQVFKIKYLFYFRAGDGFPDDLQGNDEGEVPFMKVSDINGEKLYISMANNYVSFKTVRERSWHLIAPGSILMAKIGAALTRNHRKINTVPVCIDNNMMAMTPKSILDKEFGYWLLRMINMTDYQNISSVPSINMDYLKNTYRILPSIEIQSKIASYLENEVMKYTDLINKMGQSIEAIKEFKSSLISNVVTGKVKV